MYKKTFKKSERYKKDLEGIEPDLLVFLVEEDRICKVIELKDGDSFDTKKALGEKKHLEEFSIKFGAKIPFVAEYYICCFNQEDKEFIKKGFKGEFSIDNIMTGTEICKILKIDYDEIKNIREKDTDDNFNYFIDELLKIPKVFSKVIEKLQNENLKLK